MRVRGSPAISMGASPSPPGPQSMVQRSSSAAAVSSGRARPASRQWAGNAGRSGSRRTRPGSASASTGCFQSTSKRPADTSVSSR